MLAVVYAASGTSLLDCYLAGWSARHCYGATWWSRRVFELQHMLDAIKLICMGIWHVAVLVGLLLGVGRIVGCIARVFALPEPWASSKGPRVGPPTREGNSWRENR